jgi:hypothetical protein
LSGSDILGTSFWPSFVVIFAIDSTIAGKLSAQYLSKGVKLLHAGELGAVAQDQDKHSSPSTKVRDSGGRT